jgi:hypothetical protein
MEMVLAVEFATKRKRPRGSMAMGPPLERAGKGDPDRGASVPVNAFFAEPLTAELVRLEE